MLEALIPHIWPIKVQLFHHSDTVFTVKALFPHGLGDVRSGQDIVWEEDDDDLLAIFTLGLDGETMETMGIQIEGEMIDQAEKKAAKYWKESMIWFEKM